MRPGTTLFGMQSSFARTLVVLAVFLAGGVWIGTLLEPANENAGATPVPPLRVAELRGADGARARVDELKGETVVMLSSKTCGYCKEALRDLGKLADGRPASALWLLNLEGAASADEMLRNAGVSGARALGPATSATEALLTFQTPGTPVFAVLDTTGRIVRVLSGYPGREGMRQWFAAMLGDSGRKVD